MVIHCQPTALLMPISFEVDNPTDEHLAREMSPELVVPTGFSEARSPACPPVEGGCVFLPLSHFEVVVVPDERLCRDKRPVPRLSCQALVPCAPKPPKGRVTRGRDPTTPFLGS